MRQIVLDTETTGLEVGMGHRVIEIAAVEILSRRLTGRHFHRYLNPQRDIDAGALQVHGISLDFLQDKPCFRDVAAEFLDFVRGSTGIDYNKTRLRSPVTPLMRYSLADAFVITVLHGQRHLAQARRVREMPEFPEA